MVVTGAGHFTSHNVHLRTVVVYYKLSDDEEQFLGKRVQDLGNGRVWTHCGGLGGGRTSALIRKRQPPYVLAAGMSAAMKCASSAI